MTISGGERLRQRLENIREKISESGTLRVGFLEGQTEEDGTSIPMIAAIQNYGAPRAGIPPRPFFSNAIRTHKAEWGPALSELLKRENYDAKAALLGVGAIIQGEIQQSIVDTMEPPLSPVTLMLRKMQRDDPDLIVTGKTVGEAAERVASGEVTTGVSTKPLVYSGTLLRSVGVELK